jgi:hypothetical protein
MQEMGLKKVRFPSKVDCHPPKGYVNWWEKEMKAKNGKARVRRELKNARPY